MSHLDFALAYAERGVLVFPCRPQDKIPLLLEGYKLATARPVQLAEWWTRWPEANIGIGCGASHLLVIDLDGPAAVEQWMAQYQPFVDAACAAGEPMPPIALTPRPGLHLYFRIPKSAGRRPGRFPSSIGKLGAGIDVKSEGGHVIAPPSVHPNGGRYRWAPAGTRPLDAWRLACGVPDPLGEDPSVPQVMPPAYGAIRRSTLGFPNLPGPLVEAVEYHPPQAPRHRVAPAPRTYAVAALLRAADAVRAAVPGERNNTLFLAALSIGRYVAARALPEEQFLIALVAAGCDTGLDEAEARQAVYNGLAYAVTNEEAMNDDYTNAPTAADPASPALDPLAAVEAPAGMAGRSQGARQAGRPAAAQLRPDQPVVYGGGAVPPGGRLSPAESHPLDYAQTDTGHALLLQARYGHHLRYEHNRETWLIYDGAATWRDDEKHEVDNLVVECAGAIRNAALALPEEVRKSYLRDASRLENVQRISAALARASSLPGLATLTDEFDTHPHLLACTNGVVDLHTGRLGPGAPGLLLRNSTHVAFDPDAECPRWLRFLDETFDGDAALIDYLQTVTGYTLTGLTCEHIVMVCWGTGANGKSTLFNALHKVFGDYSTQASETTFEPRGSLANTNNTNDLAGLAGKRLVTVSETAQGGKLNEARLKQMSGGDPVKVRFLNHEYFTMVPQFTVWLATNHKPPLLGGDLAVWRRVKLVPFTQSALGREDRTLGDKLAAEAPGILAWAVRGAVAYFAAGRLEQPAAVEAATAEYRNECHPFPRFVAECLAAKPGIDTTARQIHDRYTGWAEEEGAEPLVIGELGRRLKAAGFKSKRTKNGALYLGVALVD